MVKYKFKVIDSLLLLYLLLPSFFLFFYFENILSFFAVISIGIFLLWIVEKTEYKNVHINWEILFLCLVCSAIVCLFVGLFPNIIGSEQPDWLKHNTILNDLLSNPWPVIYGDNQMLNYYLGMYLLPAAIGKLFSSYLVCKIVLSSYLFVGLFLSLYKFGKELTKSKTNILIVFILFVFVILFSGWDWLSYCLQFGRTPHFLEHLEWGAGFVQLSSIVTLLSWVPQHFIPAFIGALLFKDFKIEKSVIIPISLLWSPFSAIGLFVIFIIKLIKWLLITKINIKELVSRYWIVILLDVLLAVPFLYMYYFHSNQGFTPQFIGWTTIGRYLLGDILPLIIIAILLKLFKKISIYILITVLISMFSWGAGYNDFAMRVPVPLLLMILIEFSKRIYILCKDKRWFILFLISFIWILGLPTPIAEIGRLLSICCYTVVPLNNILEIGDLARQYVGRIW
jgi:hypothetical protein